MERRWVSLGAGRGFEQTRIAITVTEVARTAEELASVADGLAQPLRGFKLHRG